MSKAKKPADYSHVTPALLKAVVLVLGEAAKHKYSVSNVYGAYNEALQKKDKAQTCSSCLRNRVRALKKWLSEYKAQLPKSDATPIREADESVYDFLVRRLALAIGDTPAEELATLNTVVETGYPNELSDEETDAVLTRIGELEAELKAEPQYSDPSAPGFVAPALGIIRIPMGEGLVPFDFTPSADDPNKGTILYASGDKVKAGTYETATGQEIAVQPGGKATLKPKEEDLT